MLAYGKTSFSPLWVFLFSRNSRERFWGLILWYFWVGKARHPGPPSLPVTLVLSFLTSVVGSARVRGEWSRLRKKGFSSIWAPACQDSSHVGNAGVGVVSLRGAPPALPTFATAQFKSFFDCGRAVRCLLSLGAGRFVHLFIYIRLSGC